MNEPFYKTMPEYARSTMNRRRNLCRKREGRQLFLIIIVSYNARYAKYREVKKATFPVFEPFSAVWLHLGSADSLSLVLLWLSFFVVTSSVLFVFPFPFKRNLSLSVRRLFSLLWYYDILAAWFSFYRSHWLCKHHQKTPGKHLPVRQCLSGVPIVHLR